MCVILRNTKAIALGSMECHTTTDASCTLRAKRKRKVLTIEDKISIIKQLEISSNKVIAEKYGVGKSTISDIKKNQEKILTFQ